MPKRASKDGITSFNEMILLIGELCNFFCFGCIFEGEGEVKLDSFKG